MYPRWAAGFGGQTNNQGRLFIALKPMDERVGGTLQDYINRLRPKIAKVRGRQAVPAADPGRARGRAAGEDRVSSTHCRTRTWPSCTSGRPKILDKLQKLPMLRDVTSDQQNGGTTATLVIDRDAAARFGIQPQVIDDTLYDAFGQRQITQYFSQVNSYHLILEVPPDEAGDPTTLDKLYVHSATGQAVPLSTFVHWTHAAGAAAVDQPPEPVPGGDDLVQPGAGRGAR